MGRRYGDCHRATQQRGLRRAGVRDAGAAHLRHRARPRRRGHRRAAEDPPCTSACAELWLSAGARCGDKLASAFAGAAPAGVAAACEATAAAALATAPRSIAVSGLMCHPDYNAEYLLQPALGMGGRSTRRATAGASCTGRRRLGSTAPWCGCSTATRTTRLRNQAALVRGARPFGRRSASASTPTRGCGSTRAPRPTPRAARPPSPPSRPR